MEDEGNETDDFVHFSGIHVCDEDEIFSDHHICCDS
jgi:hypothetical protein